MSSKSDYLENVVINHFLRNTSTAPTANVYAALYTSAPTDAGGGTEVSGGSYARVAITFSAASGGATSNSGAVTFPTATGSWGTVVAFGVFDASSGGNLLYWGNLTANKTIASGDIASFATGELDITEA